MTSLGWPTDPPPEAKNYAASPSTRDLLANCCDCTPNAFPCSPEFIAPEGSARLIAASGAVSYYSSPGLLQNRYPFGPFQVRRFSTIQV